MTREQKLRKIEGKIGGTIVKDLGHELIVNIGKYDYHLKYNSVSRFKPTREVMTDYSILSLINEEILANTQFKAVEKLDRDRVLIINTETGESIIKYKWGITIDNIKNVLTKRKRYLAKVKEVLGDKYIYTKTIVEDTTSKVTITCPEHGDFYVNLSNIINHRTGCPKCSMLKRKFGKHGFANLCVANNSVAKLYLIKCYNEEESFYKIGITQRELKERFHNIPYKTDTIIELSGNPEDIWDLELKLHSLYNKYKYLPIRDFKGKNECYKFNDESIVKKEILQISNNLLKVLHI